ncbi:MAG: MetQ/NlpA family ABC transporter substrate-binding protein [Deltaproteobacteria bacterium]|jgi:D-methionine transport system substrate-binding protein|nr:MetQ/NlpA family ABC transporter substrate-binding protein [Deltaproteobacteria bacterium]
MKIYFFWLLLVFSLIYPTWALAQGTITVGVVSGADEIIMEKVKQVAKKNGVEVTIEVFSDYLQPNIALIKKKIDINSFQHIPYLHDFNTSQKSNLVSIGNTYIAPIGFFSNKIKSLKELNEGDTVAIAQDATNGGRALLLLERAGLIKLRPGSSLLASPDEIIENPLNLKFIRLDASVMAKARDKAVMAAINANYSIEAGLNPIDDAVYVEDFESPYINVIVARAEDKDKAILKSFVEAYQSKEVADFILGHFKGSILPVFHYNQY